MNAATFIEVTCVSSVEYPSLEGRRKLLLDVNKIESVIDARTPGASTADNGSLIVMNSTSIVVNEDDSFAVSGSREYWVEDAYDSIRERISRATKIIE